MADVLSIIGGRATEEDMAQPRGLADLSRAVLRGDDYVVACYCDGKITLASDATDAFRLRVAKALLEQVDNQFEVTNVVVEVLAGTTSSPKLDKENKDG